MDKDVFYKSVSNLDIEMSSLSCQDTKSLPIIDGIINLEEYYNSENRILFVLKNPYSIEKDPGGWSVVESLNNKQSLKEQSNKGKATFRMLVAIVNIILNKQIRLDNDFLNSEYAYKLFKDNSAYINICKELIIGKSTSEDSILKTSFQKNRDVLVKQLDIYAPKFVVLGGTEKYVVENNGMDKHSILGDDNLELKKIYNRCKVFESNKRIYISVDHPSYPGRKKKIITKETYCDNIYNAIY